MNPPDFVIAGAYRSGTTTLRRWLGSHPNVFLPDLAEPSYFAFADGVYPEHMLEGSADPFRRRRTTTYDEYRDLFAQTAATQLTGECSPEYLRAPGSAGRLARCNPDCRVIISLRHPVDRFISDWKMCRRDGVERLGLQEAVLQLDTRRSAGQFGGHYEATSRYSGGLSEFFDAFPRDQILLLIHERWIGSPEATASLLGEFLGIEGSVLLENQPERDNRGGVPRGALAASAWSVRRRLAPALGGRIPTSVQRPIDNLLQRTLGTGVSHEDRSAVAALLDDEVDKVTALLGHEVPEWE